jgi:hypothetical protein
MAPSPPSLGRRRQVVDAKPRGAEIAVSRYTLGVEFLKWLTFGQGRNVGIRIEPRAISDENSDRLQQLAETIARVTPSQRPCN